MFCPRTPWTSTPPNADIKQKKRRTATCLDRVLGRPQGMRCGGAWATAAMPLCIVTGVSVKIFWGGTGRPKVDDLIESLGLIQAVYSPLPCELAANDWGSPPNLQSTTREWGVTRDSNFFMQKNLLKILKILNLYLYFRISKQKKTTETKHNPTHRDYCIP